MKYIRYNKRVQEGYILSISTGDGWEEITEEEYNTILNIINNCPEKTGYEYKLKTDLTWEETQIQLIPTDIDKLEAQILYTAAMTDTLLEE